MLPRQPCTTRLAVHRGSDLVDVVPLGLKSSFVTGRSPEVDIVLEHPSASRRHAMVLHHRSGAVYLLDLGSAHGTFLGGKRLTHHEPTVWAEGVRCVFGASSRAYVLLVTPPSSALPHPPAAPVVAAAEAETARAAVREAQVAPPPRASAEAQPVDPGLARREAMAAVVALATSTVAAGGGGAAAERGAEADAEGSGDEYLLDDECEENTRRNTAVAVRPEPRKEPQPWQQRRRVRFGAAPQLHYFEVRSPEPIEDPEATHAAAAAAAAAATAAVDGLLNHGLLNALGVV